MGVNGSSRTDTALVVITTTMNTNMNKFIHLLDCFHRIIGSWDRRCGVTEDWEDEGPRVRLSEDWSGQRDSDLLDRPDR